MIVDVHVPVLKSCLDTTKHAVCDKGWPDVGLTQFNSALIGQAYNTFIFKKSQYNTKAFFKRQLI